MKFFLSCFVLSVLLFSQTSFSQSVNSIRADGSLHAHVIAHGGGTLDGDDISMTVTLGEYLIPSDTTNVGIGIGEILISEIAPIAGINAELNVYPNPSSNLINLDLKTLESDVYVVSLKDISGKVILSGEWNVSSGQNNRAINISKYASGVYFLSLAEETSGKKVIYKIVKH